MKKSTKTIISIVAVVAAFVLVLFALGKLDSYETRLKKAMDYEQILLKEGQYAIVRIDEDRAANYHADRQGTGIVYESVCETVSNFRACRPMSAGWKDRINEDYESRNI